MFTIHHLLTIYWGTIRFDTAIDISGASIAVSLERSTWCSARKSLGRWRCHGGWLTIKIFGVLHGFTIKISPNYGEYG